MEFFLGSCSEDVIAWFPGVIWVEFSWTDSDGWVAEELNMDLEVFIGEYRKRVGPWVRTGGDWMAAAEYGHII
jgi:hypothetical protein